jgi:hypothetical protein
MRKLLFWLLVLGGAIAVIALVARKRSGSGVDEWDSFTASDSYGQASNAAGRATNAVKDAATTATNAVKDAATTATNAVKDAATTATDSVKDV